MVSDACQGLQQRAIISIMQQQKPTAQALLLCQTSGS